MKNLNKNMQNSDINLARKWRSKDFDQIIGQELCVRILKNSLYLNSFFPVYLFSGQRGCGKTSTARIFGAAINCENLASFQKDAKSFSVPCLACISCKSMQEGKHPDFIEIDAASNTGVDNVRNIIEASSLLPLIGKKKIYLIDEAHMLSKAAFNAFLKILEEPPASVLFILATTDVQKIIDTVRSRSFQLFFSSISSDSLIVHLENICKQESIEYEISGLEIIVKESEGSARDAINLLEQVRFSSPVVNKNAVLSSLGHLSDERLLELFDLIVNKKNVQDFLSFLDKINFYSFSAEFIWNRVLELLRISIRIKHSIYPKGFNNLNKLEEILESTPLNSIIFLMNEFCKNELIFHKSINKNLFLELLCLRIMNTDLNNNIEPKKKIIPNQNLNEQIKSEPKHEKTIPSLEQQGKKTDEWSSFINEIKTKSDPLLESVFSQANFINFDTTNNCVSISLEKKFIFFKELIEDTKNTWLPLLKKVFNDKCTLNIKFEEDNKTNNSVTKQTLIEKKSYEQTVTTTKENVVTQNLKTENKINFSDKEKWKMTNTLLKHFPGTITEIQEEK